MTHRAFDPLIRNLLRAAGGPGGGVSDGQLLERYARAGDEAAFETLLWRHGPMVLNTCRRVLGDRHAAEDAFQATFLVLHRKASSIRQQGSVGGWLHQIAYRIALRARRTQGRQPAVTSRLDERPAAGSGSVGPDLAPLLDEELNRLPERYRLPLVLCYLEGKTLTQAGQELGWPRGTVSGRLARGKELLRGRLTRRGVTLSAVALAGGLVQSAGAGGVPAPLVLSTLQAVTAFAAGPGALAGAVSARTAALVTGALQAMWLTQLKVAAVLLLAVGAAAGGVGVFAHHTLAEKQPAADNAQAPPPLANGVKRPPSELADERPPPADRYGDPLPAGARLRLGTTRFRHEGWAYSLAFSPDGKVLASTSYDGQGRILFWDVSTGKELRRLQTASRNERAMAIDFSPDSKTLAILGMQKIHLHDVVTGKELSSLATPAYGRGHHAKIRFSPDGKTLAVMSDEGKTRLVETATGKELGAMSGHRAAVTDIAWSPHGKVFAIATLNPAAQICDAATAKVLHALGEKEPYFSNAVAFSPDGETLAWGRFDKIVFVEAATGKERATMGNLNMSVLTGLTYTPDGRTLIASDQYGRVRFWDVPSKKERLQLDARMSVRSLALSRDGRTLAAGSHQNVIRLWDVPTGKELFQEFQGYDGAVQGVAFSPDGKLLATASAMQDGLLLWDAATGQPGRRLPVEGPHTVIFSPDGDRLITAGDERFFQVWDASTGRERFRLRQAEKPGDARRLALSPDGKYLVSAHYFALEMWDAVAGKHLRQLAGQDGGSVYSIAIAPDNDTLALGTSNGTIHLWSLRAGKETRVLRGHGIQHNSRSLAFSPDGNTLVSGCTDQSIRFWDVAAGQAFLSLRGDSRYVSAVAFSPDGRYVASGSGEGPTDEPNIIRLWEVATAKEALRLQGHHTHVCALAFSPEGTRLATGLKNATVLVWDLKSPTPGSALRKSGLEPLWTDLAGEDAARAYQAVWSLAAARQKAVAFLQGRLQPAIAVEPERLRRLIVELDSETFAVREAASAELINLGEVVVPALQQTLAGKPTLELRKRLEAILARPRSIRSPEALRTHRAIQVLEQIGSAEAGSLLERLARGGAAARETREAQAALDRLARRPVPKP